MKYIELKQGKMAELVRRSGANRTTVWRALHYKVDSELSQKIRDLALTEELGGRLVEVQEVREGFRPNCNFSAERDATGGIVRTIHNFPHGVSVVTDCMAEIATTFHRGEPVEWVRCASLQKQQCVVYEAQQLSEMFAS
ncbi:hypothetical protein [uncultured Alistipes sp.]|uniref:hypothetical protein n=1 Tax=uncultured Alistipes sp. TaxID=538949 RepID=UPI0025D78C03|nr:hypothetical protein [uncultured Alistipes sp.]